jgi:uncharacterized phage protein gp47/JayE
MATAINRRSYQSILGSQLNTARTRLGIKKFRPGGQLLTIFEAASQSDFSISTDIFNALQSKNLDNAEGLILDRLGLDDDVPRRNKKPARGEVTISDSAFTKLSSILYHGKPAPIVGSTTIYVSKNSSFDVASTSGQIYIGRGTFNYEGPLDYENKVDNSFYWTISLTNPTTKFHNLGESVILAQGGTRSIPAGQNVSTAQGAATAPVTYVTTQYAEIPDGETEITAVPVVCTSDGIVGNVSTGNIISFGGNPPFTTAVVTNPKNISFGRDTETDNTYRDRIRQSRGNRQRGTDTAIKNAIIDLSSAQETSSVLSVNIVKRKNKPTVLVIDDGNGYEEKSTGVGFETIIDSATGGETDFLTTFSPISQCYIETTNSAPYNIPDGSFLTLMVGGVVSTHYFDSSSFSSTAASAYDVISSINSDQSCLFQARTSNSGNNIVIFAKNENNDDLQVVTTNDPTTDATVPLGLQSAIVYTTSLYKNDVLLSKDGSYAQIKSNPFNNWQPLATSETLIINVDTTGTFTYTITNNDFFRLGYSLLNTATPTIWANVLTHKLPGVTATVENDNILLTSNKGKSQFASLAITGGSLVSKGMFSITTSIGSSQDYSVDRSTGSISLTTPLSVNDKLTLGTEWAEAFVQTDFGSGTLSLAADSAYDLILDDSTAQFISTSVFSANEISLVLNEATPTYSTYQVADSGNNIPILVNGLQKSDLVLLNDSAFDSNWKGVYRNNEDSIITLSKNADAACRIGHSVVAIDANQIVVFGGLTTAQNGIGAPGALKGRGVTSNCQIYNKLTGGWTQLPNMIVGRAYHTATLMLDGNIFVCGGFGVDGQPLVSTEIFDTSTLTFSEGPDMDTARAHHSATLLTNSGMVLIAGGISTTDLGDSALTSSIQYNPVGESYQNPGTMNVARYGHQAVLDQNQIVVVFGGISTIASPAVPLSSVESYMDTFATWTNRNPMSVGRAFFGASYLPNGGAPKILVAGNGVRLHYDNRKSSVASTGTSQLYDSDTDTWASVSQLNSNLPALTLEFIQSDLVLTNNSIITAGYVNASNSTVKTLTYDVDYDTWNEDVAASGISTFLSNREATTGAAFVGTNIAAWFGGVSVIDQTLPTFNGITNADQVDTENLTRTHKDPVFTDLTLNNNRLLIVRSNNSPVRIIVPSNSGYIYTADSLTPIMSLTTDSVRAESYQTTKIRLSTVSTDGSILMVDKDPALPTFSPTNNVVSQRSQFATVTSPSVTRLPLGFQLKTVGSVENTDVTAYPQFLTLPQYSNDLGSGYLPEPNPANGTILGLTCYPFGNSGLVKTDHLCKNAVNCKSTIKHVSTLGITSETDTSTVVSLGEKMSVFPSTPVTPGNPVCIAGPFKFDITDTLNVIIDNDRNTKRFIVPMARKMGTNSTYDSTLSLKDADNNNATISSAFGIDYNFDDFAIVSRARALTHSGTASKRLLWRYSKYGQSGNNVAVRYVFPDVPSAPISVTSSITQEPNDFSYYQGQPKATVDICIGSSGLRQNRNVSANTRYGITKGHGESTNYNVWVSYLFVGFSVVEGSRAGLNGDTVLKITVPYAPGISGNPGINVGDVLWYDSPGASSSTLQNGQFRVKTVGNLYAGIWYITLDAGVLNDGTVWPAATNPGTVSTDPTQKASFDSTVVVGDLLTIIDPNDIVTSKACKISEIDTNRQYLQFYTVNFDPTSHTTPTYFKVGKSTDISVFEAPTNTAAQIAAAVNALENCPVTATVTGTGLGIIDSADWFENFRADARTNLTDGINYVAVTNKPANTTLPTTFSLKLPVTGSLKTNSDFSNEIFYLVPQLPTSVVQWLNTPTITGLWSVADIVLANNSDTLQIRSKTPGSNGSVFVEGGAANSKSAAIVGSGVSSTFNYYLKPGLVVTTSNAEAEGFCGDGWVELNNTYSVNKVNDLTSTWGANNNVTSITSTGVITFNTGPYSVETITNYNNHTYFNVEKIGDYVALMFYKGYGSIFTNYAKAGSWIYIKNNNIEVNNGLYRIIRFTQTESVWVYWIENSAAINQEGAFGDVLVISEDSPIPGDILSINSDAFGASNRTSWTITDVGNSYTDNTITVSVSDKTLVPFVGAVDTLTKDIAVIEKTPAKAVKKILCIAPNPTNTNRTDLLLDDNALLYAWQQTSGTVITALDKIQFNNSQQNGTDAYRYNTGLIAEVKRVVYGDSADLDNYSGYAASGAQILFQGPIVKRISITVQVRLQNNNTNVISAIKSVIAGVINGSPVGLPIPISEVVSAINSVNGVTTVSILYPEFTPVKDQISVHGQEKAKVIDLENDIKVLVVGN